MPPASSLIAADVGNSRTKLGWFPAAAAAEGSELPVPAATLELAGVDWATDSLAVWIEQIGPASQSSRWLIASVNRPAARRLESAIAEIHPQARPVRLSAVDLPLIAAVDSPDAVGIDRLLGAVAANRIRSPDRAVIVIHVGTAITVNLVAADGSFRGGAILPGIALAARALAEHTDLLPRIDMIDLTEPPPVVGTATEPAIRSGLFWGAVGAMRELAARMGGNGSASAAEVLLTGGAAPSVAHLLGDGVRYEPHLVLAGIALAAYVGPPERS